MRVEFTKDAEAKRVANPYVREDKTWALLSTVSIVEAVRFAKDNGWLDKKVQVRAERLGDDLMCYYVEPYEKGCGCWGLLRYEDYFEPPLDPQI